MTVLNAFSLVLILLVMMSPMVTPETAAADELDSYTWYDVSDYGVEGKGWADTKAYYDRLPAAAEGVVRDEVWVRSRNSTGMSFRFITDAPAIAAMWHLTSDRLDMVHMAATAVSGIDLYVRGDDGNWRWLGDGRPSSTGQTRRLLVQGMRPGTREYMINLPLYNGVSLVKIGLPQDASFEPGPDYPAGTKPVVFYGTSITQGAVASRPGMAYPAILGRRLQMPTINLGFSGQGRGEPEVAELLAQLDPAAYVLDPLPNMSPSQVAERLPVFIGILRKAHPETPIVLVESIPYADAPYVPSRAERYQGSNQALAAIYQQLRDAGDDLVFYVRSEALWGDDGETTVDGTHATDLGFFRMADAMEPVLREALGRPRQ